jgi:serine/threonine-protein kinase
VTIAAATRLGRYEIRSKIGAGGMGEVYLAQDTRLDRKVALKFLPAELAGNQDRMRRFTQEAKSAAALNHPNIAHIYEIGESDGVNFIAMEFIDGATLREKIHREHTELRKLLRYLQQVAEGLAKAHAAGIVHRDLKPDNVMITRDGYAKILDFGLAKLTEQTPPPGVEGEAPTAVMRQPLSTPGVVMGTVGYMSPEQAQARAVDHRSDIFSFGCLLYEAATGQRAFASESTIDTLHKIVHAPVPLVKDVNPAAPADLTRIVRRCLAKDPDDRYQSIREAAIELRELRRELEGAEELDTTVPPSSLGSTISSGPPVGATASGSRVSTAPASSAEYVITGIRQHKLAAATVLAALVMASVGLAAYLHVRSTTVAIKSIAVMPFVNEGGNADLEYLSDGMTDTLTSSLSQLSNLNVKGRSSVFRYKGKETNPQTIGKELNVQAILNGRVAQHGDQLTLTWELVDTQTENIIWSEQYDRKQADLVALRSEIARDVTSKLKIKLSDADKQKLTKNYTVNPEAFRFYLLGRFYWNKRTGESLKTAIDFFNQAIEKDPNYALAYAGLASSYAIFPEYSGMPAKDYEPKAEAAANKALEIDETLPEAHAVLGLYKENYEWDWAGAEREFRRAIELDPNSSTAHQWYSIQLSWQGRLEEAMAEIKRAQLIDPLSLIINVNIGVTYRDMRQYDRAVDQYKKVLELDPNFPLARANLGSVYLQQGKFDDAIAEYQKVRAVAGNEPRGFSGLGYAYARAGKKNDALQILNQLLALSKQGFSLSYEIAFMHAGLGDKDQAFEWLNKAYEDHNERLRELKMEPAWDNFRSEPRFADLLQRVGLEP